MPTPHKGNEAKRQEAAKCPECGRTAEDARHDLLTEHQAGEKCTRPKCIYQMEILWLSNGGD